MGVYGSKQEQNCLGSVNAKKIRVGGENKKIHVEATSKKNGWIISKQIH